MPYPEKKTAQYGSQWQALQLFNLYRFALAIGFLAVNQFRLEINFFGVMNELLYVKISTLYLISSILFLLLSCCLKYQYLWQANASILMDVIALILVMHACGGINSGVGILLIIIVAAHSILVPGKFSLLSAALATIGLSIEYGYSYLTQYTDMNMYSHVGLLGLGIVVTAFVTNMLSIQARKSQKMIESQAVQLVNAQQLNAHISSAIHARELVGNITSNIAHELRNPLGAASHAAQLLAESHFLSKEDQNLVHMIKHHCERMNSVIHNVLSLSGKKLAKVQKISLIPWLEKFINELSIPEFSHPTVTLQYDARTIYIQTDPSQLTQILINLCENGLRYNYQKNGQSNITLRVHGDIHSRATHIDIIDQGIGIDPTLAEYIFEPFFTTEKTGSGLGLTIARELSQMNGIHLGYSSKMEEGSQFRITIPYGEIP